MRVFISDRANTDLLQIIQYLAERNPVAAGRRDIDAEFQR
jgi:plasmid stabilization system protein ParE